MVESKKKVSKKKATKAKPVKKKKAEPDPVGVVEEEEIEEAVKPTKAKKDTTVSEVSLTTAQKVMLAMNQKNSRKKQENRPKYDMVIFDPDDPLEVADTWVTMPFPWKDLTGVRGVPFGHITTIQGKPDSGKTTIAMHAMIEAQLQGYTVVLIDTEYKFNFKRFRDMGGSVSELIVFRAQTLESGFDAIDNSLIEFRKIDKNKPVLYVWDSVGMTPTDNELNNPAGKVSVSEGARVIKRNIRRMVAKIHSTKTGIIFINHIYSNINAMFGASTKGYGGDGPAYASVLVLEVQKIKAIKSKAGGKTHTKAVVSAVKCTKNHLSSVQGGVAQVKIGPAGIVTGEVELASQKDGVDSYTGLVDELDDEEKALGME